MINITEIKWLNDFKIVLGKAISIAKCKSNVVVDATSWLYEY